MVRGTTSNYLQGATNMKYKSWPADDKKNIAKLLPSLQRPGHNLKVPIIRSNSIVCDIGVLHTHSCVRFIWVNCNSFSDFNYVFGLFSIGNKICTCPLFLFTPDQTTFHELCDHLLYQFQRTQSTTRAGCNFVESFNVLSVHSVSHPLQDNPHSSIPTVCFIVTRFCGKHVITLCVLVIVSILLPKHFLYISLLFQEASKMQASSFLASRIN